MFTIKKNLQLVLSLCSSIFGISLIFFASLFSVPQKISTSELTSGMVGNTVTVYGEISKRTQSNAGHIFLTLDKKVQVPIFSQLAEKLDENVLASLKVGQKISVSGTVDEYQSNLQVVPRSLSDIVIGGD